MAGSEVRKCLEEMDILKNNFTNCRAFFPNMTEENVGATNLITAPFYIRQGFNITFQFSSSLTKEEIQKNNDIAHWINQNFIIRLSTLLESYHVFSNKININQTIEGWEAVDLVRRLRHKFAHSSGRYNSKNNDNKKLMELIISYLKLELNTNNLQEFPVSIDSVLYPLFDGCKKYVEGKHIERVNYL